MDNYEINAATLCIIPIDKEKSYVYEYDKKFIVNMPIFKIIERSCLFFGSTYDGRRQSSCFILNTMHKVPIIIEETRELVFFPTNSPGNKKCMWISYNNLECVDKINSDYSMLSFKNDNKIKVAVSYFILTNQLIRCKKLKVELKNRKKAV